MNLHHPAVLYIFAAKETDQCAFINLRHLGIDFLSGERAFERDIRNRNRLSGGFGFVKRHIIVEAVICGAAAERVKKFDSALQGIAKGDEIDDFHAARLGKLRDVIREIRLFHIHRPVGTERGQHLHIKGFVL